MDGNIIEGLYTADCVDFMTSMPTGCVDLVVTSPPYENLRNYKGYAFEFERIAESLFKVVKEGGVVVWVVGDKINGGRSLTSFRQGLYFQEIGFNMHDVMIYQKKIRRLCVQMLIQMLMNLCLFYQKESRKRLIQ
jgi:site-specific DNA-methyltransferase (adenine-specific)